MFTPPLAPGADHEQVIPLGAVPSLGCIGMKYGPMRQRLAILSAESLIAGV
jgi:hypothetical protein